MSIPTNTNLYNQVKREADEIYKTHSAYKSGFIVRRYKAMGGKYKDTNEEKTLSRWFAEKWMDINPNKTKNSYPVYRPTVRINEKTPKTQNEITTKRLLEQSKLKQVIKGYKSLPKF